MQEYGQDYLDIMGVSCDSFKKDTNLLIGRWAKGASKNVNQDHSTKVFLIKEWCLKHGVAFKLNTVVNSHNWEEDMNEQLIQLNPVRWKVFQCLELEGENSGPKAKRDVKSFLITNEQFQAFLDRHKKIPSLIPEANETMRDSYLLMDERLRFLDCSGGSKIPS